MKKNVLTQIQGYLLVSDGTKEDTEIFGEEYIRCNKIKKDGCYYRCDSAPIEKGTYLVVENKIIDKDPLYEARLIHYDMLKDKEVKLYKLG